MEILIPAIIISLVLGLTILLAKTNGSPSAPATAKVKTKPDFTKTDALRIDSYDSEVAKARAMRVAGHNHIMR